MTATKVKSSAFQTYCRRPRCGLFDTVEPLTGSSHIEVLQRHAAVEFAHQMRSDSFFEPALLGAVVLALSKQGIVVYTPFAGHLQRRCPRHALVDMQLDEFMRPVAKAVTAQFVIATAAALHMAPRRTDVILVMAGRREAIPNLGGSHVAWAALAELCRQLASEVGPAGSVSPG